ncbi:MAG: ABC transporter permease subunit [Kiritimatiellia bacterium]
MDTAKSGFALSGLRRLNPLTVKRLRRFRNNRRAWWSLLILVVLYVLSLCSELICNDRPIYIRFRSKSYFPIFKYYPEDTFLGNGHLTRPNYKKLKATPLFTNTPGNIMIFPPVPFGPYESITPESLAGSDEVTLVFKRVPRSGNVNIGSDYRVVRANSAGYFFGVSDEEVRGIQVTEFWHFSGDVLAALKKRFRNEHCPELSITCTSAKPPFPKAVLTLPAFTPRSQPPESVRIVFNEPPIRAAFQKVVFTPGQTTPKKDSSLWLSATEEQRRHLSQLAQRRFAEPVMSEEMTIAGALYRVTAERTEVAWPHRPVPGHPLGIDNAGRDVLARILYGLRTSMTFALLLVVTSMTLGIIIGAIQGFLGGKTDLVTQRLIEIWSSLPFLYVMILLGSVYGRSFWLLLLCYGIFNWIGISYYIRAEFLRLRNMPFVDAARCMGVSPIKIMFRHIMPNALTPVITFFPFSLVGAIEALAALDYLGFGLPPPTPSWGELLLQGQQVPWAWWLILYPSLALFLVVLLGVFVGEGLRDAYDPRVFSRLE